RSFLSPYYLPIFRPPLPPPPDGGSPFSASDSAPTPPDPADSFLSAMSGNFPCRSGCCCAQSPSYDPYRHPEASGHGNQEGIHSSCSDKRPASASPPHPDDLSAHQSEGTHAPWQTAPQAEAGSARPD